MPEAGRKQEGPQAGGRWSAKYPGLRGGCGGFCAACNACPMQGAALQARRPRARAVLRGKGAGSSAALCSAGAGTSYTHSLDRRGGQPPHCCKRLDCLLQTVCAQAGMHKQAHAGMPQVQGQPKRSPQTDSPALCTRLCVLGCLRLHGTFPGRVLVLRHSCSFRILTPFFLLMRTNPNPKPHVSKTSFAGVHQLHPRFGSPCASACVHAQWRWCRPAEDDVCSMQAASADRFAVAPAHWWPRRPHACARTQGAIA